MKDGCTKGNVKTGKSIALPVVQSTSIKEEAGKSRSSRWRAAVLITLNLLMIAHVIQWRITGSTISPIEPSETMYTLQRGAINAGLIFFSLAILATMIFGRFVCGWGCHIVALQDFCAWLLKKVGLVPKPFRSRLLVYVPLIAALYMFVWPTLLRAVTKPAAEPLIPPFSNHLVTTNFWETFPPVGVAIPFLFICGFLTVYFLGAKGFCTYACPYGGFFSLADKVAPGRIRVTDACNQCGNCTATCTSNVLVHAEVKKFGMVVDPGCMKCMDCVSVCPNDALYFGFGKPSIAVSKSSARKQSYSLAWPEEIVGAVVFFVSYFAVWDVYQLVPMLMALGCAAVTTFLTLKVWRLLRSKELTFYRFYLKGSGKMLAAGWVFLGFAVIWIGLNAHSGLVRYHQLAGSRAFRQLQVADELMLAQVNPAQWLTPADREQIDSGKAHLQAAANMGLFVNSDTLPKLAWFLYLSGSTEQAIRLLAQVAPYQHGQAQALSLYYRGAMLNRSGRYNEALQSFDDALAERPDLILAREEKGESLWQLGRKAEAISVWRGALRQNPNLILVRYQLAGALATSANSAEARTFEKEGDQLVADNPYYRWMLGLRLQNLGMNELGEKQFQQAIKLDPAFQLRRSRRSQ